MTEKIDECTIVADCQDGPDIERHRNVSTRASYKEMIKVEAEENSDVDDMEF